MWPAAVELCSARGHWPAQIRPHTHQIPPQTDASTSTARRRWAAWWIALPTLLALAYIALQGVKAQEFDRSRYVILVVGALVLAWAAALNAAPARLLLARVVLSAMAALVFWVGVLDWLLGRGPVLAQGLLGVAAASVVHGLILFAIVRRAVGARSGSFLLRIGALFATLAVGVLLLEIVLGAVFPPSVYQVVPDDPQAGSCWYMEDGTYRARPGFRGKYMHPEFPGTRIDINEWGLRDGLDDATPPAAGAKSVLVLGDSFAFGTGVELAETFHVLLENRHAEVTSAPLRVYSATAPGHGPIDATRMLRAYADRTRPDIVVYALCEANDFTDTADEEARLATEFAAGRLGGSIRLPEVVAALGDALPAAPDPAGSTEPAVPADAGGEKPPMPPSAAKPADNLPPPSTQTAPPAPPQPATPPAVPRMGLDKFLEGLVEFEFWKGSCAIVQVSLHWFEGLFVRLGLILPHGVNWNAFGRESFRVTEPEFVTKGAERVRVQLGVLKRECEKIGAGFVVLLVPAVSQADPARFEDQLAYTWNEPRSNYERRGFHVRFADRLREQFADVVDPLPALEQALGSGVKCYHREGHWTAKGHAIAAEHLIPVLKARLLE